MRSMQFEQLLTSVKLAYAMLVQRFRLEQCVNCRLSVRGFSQLVTRQGTLVGKSFIDPCVNLQEYLEVPLFREYEKLFVPTVEEMKSAVKLFEPNKHHEIKFLKSSVKFEDAANHTLPEVAFIGESNVGKSSLLEAILSMAPNVIVRTSKTPGLTKTINFYTIGKKCCLVDVPGYGFNQPEHFVTSVESYIRQRPNLVRTFMLIDGSTGFSDYDQIALGMLEEFRVPYAFVFTKIDLASTSVALSNLMKWKEIRDRQTTPSCFPQPFLLSAKTGAGLGFLMTFIAHITGNFSIKAQ